MISICSEMFYNDIEFYDRLNRIKSDGANTIEFWRWANKDIEKIKKLKEQLEIKVCGFCVDSMDDETSKCISKNILTLGLKEELLKALKKSKKLLTTDISDMNSELQTNLNLKILKPFKLF